MVSHLAIIFICSIVVISVGFPIMFFIIFKKKTKVSWLPLIIGVAVFIIFSQILEKILHTYLLHGNSATEEWFKQYPLLFAIYGGIAAGVFEEFGRFIGLRFLLKRQRNTWKDGLAYGIGHGGIESIIGGIGGALQYFTVAILINTNQLNILSHSTEITEIKEQLLQHPVFLVFGGVEKLFAFMVQLGLSLLVLYAVLKNKRFLLYAILIHALVDFIAVYLGQEHHLMWLVEIIFCILAVCSLICIVKSKRLFPIITSKNN